MQLRLLTIIVGFALTTSIFIIRQKAQAQNSSPQPIEKTGTIADAVAAKTDDPKKSPIFGVTIPAGYRDWRLISVAREEGNLNDIRAILGNDVAIMAYREEKLAFPNGTIIARLAWSYDASEENNKAFGRTQSFVAGPPKDGVQFMVKDSRKYALTGGWGFAQFNDGQPADEAVHITCFACHESAKARDFVFTPYAPWPPAMEFRAESKEKEQQS
jgi:hypothetical protein